MANLKIGRGNSVDSIAFRMPLNILKKHSEKKQDSHLNNIISNQDNMTTELNSQNIIIHLNKSIFINDMLKNDLIDDIPRCQFQNPNPSIIEYR